MSNIIQNFFPYEKPRQQQIEAIKFGVETLLRDDKKYCIIEAGTGVGKSAIGVTIGRILNSKIKHADDDFEPGSYFLTTQKVLQRQYEDDFSAPNGRMQSVYSSANYTCGHHRKNDCRTSQQMLRTAKKGSPFFKHCTQKCAYKASKKSFIESSESVTNFPYFITESTYSGKIKPRNLLVIDEAHNTEEVLSKFVEVGISQYFCEKIVKCRWPSKITPVAFVKWVKDTYFPKLQAQILHFENQIENLGLASKMKELASISLKYDMLTGHSNKLEIFLSDYSSDNWVMEKQETEKRGYVKIVYRAIDVSKFAESYLFRMGYKVLFMSATILNAEGFAKSLGIAKDDYAAISIPSPFPIENRPIFQAGVGSMSAKMLEHSLPNLKKAVQEIMKQHSDEKGIIHCHTYRIARYLKYNIKDHKLRKRILIHNSQDRDEILKKHMTSKEPTVLLSPSMTEGVDLKGDLSRFQIICKVPYPYLGDQITRKRMNKNKKWYPMKTAMSIVQAYGRSVRSQDDSAVTYILDSDWRNFYNRNRDVFPAGFKECLVR